MHMPTFKIRNDLDKVFVISILLKALDGIIETIGGLVLLFVRPSDVNHLIHFVTQEELSEDPKDFLANHILHSVHYATHSALLFGAIYLLAHGLSKVVLVIEILRDRLWAYIGLVVLTIGFIVYQIYRITFVRFSITLTLLTLFDCLIVYLTSREYGRQKRLLATHGPKGD
ncbi:MAG TPA: DUF2127 domain-containing protein [Candidatus Saccharimonadales bacterium]|nr:DUF2127 domain-containing protein [Candidatus Saccharimonadales bacterium]